MEQQSVHMLKIREDRLFVSAAVHIETAAAATLCDVPLKCEPRY